MLSRPITSFQVSSPTRVLLNRSLDQQLVLFSIQLFRLCIFFHHTPWSSSTRSFSNSQLQPPSLSAALSIAPLSIPHYRQNACRNPYTYRLSQQCNLAKRPIQRGDITSHVKAAKSIMPEGIKVVAANALQLTPNPSRAAENQLPCDFTDAAQALQQTPVFSAPLPDPFPLINWDEIPPLQLENMPPAAETFRNSFHSAPFDMAQVPAVHVDVPPKRIATKAAKPPTRKAPKLAKATKASRATKRAAAAAAAANSSKQKSGVSKARMSVISQEVKDAAVPSNVQLTAPISTIIAEIKRQRTDPTEPVKPAVATNHPAPIRKASAPSKPAQKLSEQQHLPNRKRSAKHRMERKQPAWKPKQRTEPSKQPTTTHVAIQNNSKAREPSSSRNYASLRNTCQQSLQQDPEQDASISDEELDNGTSDDEYDSEDDTPNQNSGASPPRSLHNRGNHVGNSRFDGQQRAQPEPAEDGKPLPKQATAKYPARRLHQKGQQTEQSDMPVRQRGPQPSSTQQQQMARSMYPSNHCRIHPLFPGQEFLAAQNPWLNADARMMFPFPPPGLGYPPSMNIPYQPQFGDGPRTGKGQRAREMLLSQHNRMQFDDGAAMGEDQNSRDDGQNELTGELHAADNLDVVDTEETDINAQNRASGNIIKVQHLQSSDNCYDVGREMVQSRVRGETCNLTRTQDLEKETTSFGANPADGSNQEALKLQTRGAPRRNKRRKGSQLQKSGVGEGSCRFAADEAVKRAGTDGGAISGCIRKSASREERLKDQTEEANKSLEEKRGQKSLQHLGEWNAEVGRNLNASEMNNTSVEDLPSVPRQYVPPFISGPLPNSTFVTPDDTYNPVANQLVQTPPGARDGVEEAGVSQALQHMNAGRMQTYGTKAAISVGNNSARGRRLPPRGGMIRKSGRGGRMDVNGRTHGVQQTWKAQPPKANPSYRKSVEESARNVSRFTHPQLASQNFAMSHYVPGPFDNTQLANTMPNGFGAFPNAPWSAPSH